MGGKILIVDDEPGIRHALGQLLEAQYSVRRVASAEEALALPPEESAAIRLVLLDGLLGAGLSGRDALPLIRRQFVHASIIYIGALGPLDAADLLQAGATQVLPKPWAIADLLAAAKQACRDPA